MLILCFNVAGLSTTVQRIHEAYGGELSAAKGNNNVKSGSVASSSSSSSSHKPPSSPALATFFARHGADIVCLQEHKIPIQQLSSRSEPRLASRVEGFESFWSCCVDSKKKGLNGVCTYARTGSVVSADAAPLGSPELDRQGRCVMTDHGTFVLFNVYVPAGGGQPLEYKMKFLNALRRAMQRQRREKKKPVILVGDLNISHSTLDVFWQDRVLNIKDILEEVQSHDENKADSGASPPKWKKEIGRNWANIKAVMETSEVVETQTTNSLTKEKYDKFRLAVTLENGKKVFLGQHEVTREHCEYRYDFASRTYSDSDSGEERPANEDDVIRIGVLAELMFKIAGVQWDESDLREIAATDATVAFTPPRKWLSDLLDEDEMVDGFRHFYPTAQARFTCWHQFTNKRYENNGARIDYTIVDKCLLPRVSKGDVPGLRCYGDLTAEEAQGEKAAFLAATANGRFRPVSFEGGGISEASQEALDTQFGPAHTGMIYTPPSFSDHIAISLLMDDALLLTNQTLESDERTKKAQPHKQQKTMYDFFGGALASGGNKKNRKSGSSSTSSAPAGAAKRLKKDKKPPKNSILHHFKKKT